MCEYHAYAQIIVDINNEEVDRMFTYLVPPQMQLQCGVRVFVPFGPRTIAGMVVGLANTTDVPQDKLKSVISVIDDEPVVLPELMELAYFMRERYRSTMAGSLRCILPSQVRSGKIRPLSRLAARLVVDKQDALSACKRSSKQQELIDHIAQQPDGVRISHIPLGGALATARALEKKALVEIFPMQVRRIPYQYLEQEMDTFTLSEPQHQAVERICASFDGEMQSFLLHGVTGSGKTEVYMHAVRQVLLRGKGAIILVPEISLTPQMVSWFRARFGDNAAVLHSGLSQGEKYDEWQRIREGDARVVIGARSAVFAPVESLGLVIVDEEHEQTYKSDTHPCYDAREVARERCRLQHATLVLGSATPSVDTYTRALRGHYELLEMNKRVAGRALPTVEIVDMRQEIILGNRSMFSRALHSAIEETLLAGRQVLLFHNRRGHSSFVKCRACGYTVHCPHCDVTMTFHSMDDTLKCHYCGTTMRSPKTCPACTSPYIRRFGVGTQQIEEKLKEEFPMVKSVRMDADTTQSKDSMAHLLSTFRKGDAQVLIGTQMIAKGHDFPNVTLVGVIAADMTLDLPDYRSEERTFQLLTQVEGRAGRGVDAGRVIVQTYEPEHYAIIMAATQDYRAFYDAEITRRRRRLYPPYTIMMRILLTGREESEVRATAELLEIEIGGWFAQDKQRKTRMIQVHAMEAPLKRIRDEYRHQVFIKMYAKDSDDALDFIVKTVSETQQKGVRLDVELDPASFM